MSPLKRQIHGRIAWIPAFIFVVACIAAFKAVDNVDIVIGWIRQILRAISPFFVGFVIAFLLYAPVSKLDKLFSSNKNRFLKRFSRGLSVLIVYLILAGLIALLVATAVPAIINGVTGLINAAPEYYKTVTNWIADNQKNDFIRELDLNTRWSEFYQNTIQPLLKPDQVTKYIQGVLSVASSIANFIIAVVASVFMLLSRETLLGNLRVLAKVIIPRRAHRTIGRYINKSTSIFYSYIYIKLIDAVINGLLILPGLLIAGIPYWLALTILTAVTALIPYFGSIIATIAVDIIALLTGNVGGAVFFTIYSIVMQQIDGNLIQPKLFGQSVGIRPFYVLLAIALGGGLGGFWGLLISVPIMAVLQMLVRDGIYYLKHRHDNDPPEPPEGGPFDRATSFVVTTDTAPPGPESE